MRILIILFLSSFLAGCGLFKEKEIRIPVPVYTKVQCPDYGKIDPIETLNVEFKIAIDPESKDYLLGLTGKDYSYLAINTRRAIDYIGNQQVAIEYYKGCIERHNAKAEQEKGEQ